MKDKAEKLIEICTKLLQTAAQLEIVDLQLDTTMSSERVGHPNEGYNFTGYGEVTLKVMFAPPSEGVALAREGAALVKEIADEVDTKYLALGEVTE